MIARACIVRPILLAVLACGALDARTAAAQAPPEEEPRAFCWEGRPAESCRAFLVAEAGAHALLEGSRYPRTGYQGEVTRSRHLAGYAAWEVGAMVNRGPRDAVGATVLVGGDPNGLRLALKGRYRRWMGRTAAVDAGAGVLLASRADPNVDRPGNSHVPAVGATAEVAAGYTDWIGMSLRGDLLVDGDGERASGVYAGLKLGARPGAVGTLAPLLAALVIFLAVDRGD